MQNRIDRLHDYMERHALDAALITLPKHVYYLTGFLSDPHERFLGLVLRRGEEPFLLVPVLDAEAAGAASSVKQIYTHKDTEDPYQVLQSYLGAGVRHIGVEKSHLTVQRYEALQAVIAAERFFDLEEPLREMRLVKSADEIVTIKRAVRIIEDVLRTVVAKVKPGVTEIELVAEVEYQMKKLGAEGPSFDSMVLAGDNAAKPHGSPGTRQVQRGELLLFDIGVFVGGYASDITRTFAVGDVGDKQKAVYEAVLGANKRGIAAVAPGVVLADLDRTARDYIESQGYGPYFMHRLGHGLGLDIHEYPSVHGSNQDLLREGMVITIEPGIYIPGVAGVRIEDDVLVTASGVEVLTSFPKELTVIGE